ncbi:MAG: SAM-dependent chlorinase/fluorinase [Gemmatimonadaceae bacterium]
MSPIITLLTDFGTADGFVGEMKGVLLNDAPAAVLVDISHELAPHDVQLGRLTLARYWQRFPAGTVHLAVVDPGVGSSRAALAVECEGRFLVGPDNGLLSPALVITRARAVVIPVPAGAAPTFHGRDVFAPAAARLANGDPLDALGEVAASPVILRTPLAQRSAAGELQGEVIAIDRFGNAITSLLAARGSIVSVAGHELPLCRTYADLPRGEAGAVTGSSGFIEIVVREGRAADVLRLARGAPVTLR